MKYFFKFKLFLFFIIITFSNHLYSEVFKWVDKEGKVHYGDRVPQEYRKDSKPIVSKNLNYIGGKHKALTLRELREAGIKITPELRSKAVEEQNRFVREQFNKNKEGGEETLIELNKKRQREIKLKKVKEKKKIKAHYDKEIKRFRDFPCFKSAGSCKGKKERQVKKLKKELEEKLKDVG